VETIENGVLEIFNTDQGSQYTSEIHQNAEQWDEISMDGKGHAIDNIFIERMWEQYNMKNILTSLYRWTESLRGT
jgi:putative transposase